MIVVNAALRGRGAGPKEGTDLTSGMSKVAVHSHRIYDSDTNFKWIDMLRNHNSANAADDSDALTRKYIY